jgi:hypothetical protein
MEILTISEARAALHDLLAAADGEPAPVPVHYARELVAAIGADRDGGA